MEYREIIDKLLNQMEAEITSAHELTTKAINIQFTMGKLYGLYNLVEQTSGQDDFIALYDYRRADRDRISTEANLNIINKVYDFVRAANGRKTA